MTLYTTPIPDLSKAHAAAQAAFHAGKTRDIAFRKRQLKALERFLDENAAEILEACAKDLVNIHPLEVNTTLNCVRAEIIEHYMNVEKWSKPHKVHTDLAYKITRPKVFRQAKGTVLVMGAWNYNLSLTLTPFIGAISAGCTAVVKPSDISPAISNLIIEKLPKYLDTDAYHFVAGAIPETTELLKLPWDHIFYTGNGTVGRIIARAAAEHLTPVTLELGGKSPSVILDDLSESQLDTTAKRLLWGKYFNAGQTCIAPDYIIVSSATKPALIAAFKRQLGAFSAENMASIVNGNHYGRLSSLLESSTGSKIDSGSKGGANERNILPTIVTDIGPEDPLMKDEIFGPFLPIVEVDTLDAKIEYIVKNHDTPLALYVFGNNRKEVDRIFFETRSGSLFNNDVILQYSIAGVPFGGVGQSGYGNYHGEYSFNTFTYERPYLTMPFFAEFALQMRYPPYTASKMKQLQSMGPGSIAGAERRKSLTRGLKFALSFAVAAILAKKYNLSSLLKSFYQAYL